MTIPLFSSNYPHFQPGPATLLPTPERVGALHQYTGRDVRIAFIDAGFYPHPDLHGRILMHVDASTQHVIEQVGDFEITDLSWHGQMTSVIACGDGKKSDGKYRGIASRAQLILVKVSTPRGHIKEADILRGLRWVFDTHQRLNIRIVNISVGGDEVSTDPDHPLHRTVRKLVQAGVTVVVAAGNRHADYLLPPASAAEGITIGGVDDNNSHDCQEWKSYHHNYGAGYDGLHKPELLANAAWIASPIMPNSMVDREARWLAPLLSQPDEKHLRRLLIEGHADLGLQPEEIQNGHIESVYQRLQQRLHAHKIIDLHHQHVDGTSVAAPIVTSVIAQMLEANPRLTPAEIRAILTVTATPLQGIPQSHQGAGLINASAAVQTALSKST